MACIMTLAWATGAFPSLLFPSLLFFLLFLPAHLREAGRSGTFTLTAFLWDFLFLGIGTAQTDMGFEGCEAREEVRRCIHTHTHEGGGRMGGFMTTLSDDDGSVGLLRSEDLDVLEESC